MTLHFVLGLVLASLAACSAHETSSSSTAPQPPPDSAAYVAPEPAASTATPKYVHPAIAGYGRAVALPTATDQPDPELHYRVVFDITAAPPNNTDRGAEVNTARGPCIAARVAT